MKRNFSILLIVAMMLMLTNLPALGAEAKIIVNETFVDFVTNAAPARNSLVGAYGTRIIADGARSKAVLMRANDDGNSTYTINASLPKQFVLSADIEIGKNVDKFKIFSLKNAKNVTCDLLQYTADDGFTIALGKSITPAFSGKTVNISAVVDMGKKTYSVYFDYNLIIENWPLDNIAFADPSAFLFDLFSKEGSVSDVVIHSVHAYSGLQLINSFPALTYNEKEVAFTNETENKETQAETVTYFRQTFDALKAIAGSGLQMNAKGSKIVLADNGNGNKYVLIDHTVDDPYFDIDVGNQIDSSRIVVSADVAIFDNDGSKDIFNMRDTSNNLWSGMLRIQNNGDLVISSTGQTVGNLKLGKFRNIAFAMNFARKTFDVYIDNELKAKNAPFANPMLGNTVSFRFQMTPQSGEKMGVDNIYIYSGNKLKSAEELSKGKAQKAISVYKDDGVAIKQLGKNVAFMLNSGAAFANGKKFIPQNAAIIENNRVMVPVRLIAEAFGVKVNWDENTKTVDLDGKTQFKIGEKTIKSNNQTIELDTPAMVKNGSTYLPLRVIGEKVLNKVVSWDDRGFIVIGDTTFNPNNSKTDIEEAYNYLLYDRPKANDILKTYNASPSKGQHPRIMASKSDFDKLREELKTNVQLQQMAKKAIVAADSKLTATKVTYDIADGLRLMQLWEVGSRLLNLAMAYQLTLDKKYADRAFFEIQTVAEFKDWNPHHFLDPSEAMLGCALAYDWCYDAFTDKQRAFISKTLKEKGLGAAYDSIYGINESGWTKMRNNWNSVCNGAIIIASIAFMDEYPEYCSDLIEKGFRGLEYFLEGFAPDGGWREGTSYWELGIKYIAPLFATVDSGFGTTFNYFNAPGIHKTPYFVIALDGSQGTFNFADNGGGFINSPELNWFAKKLNDPLIGRYRTWMLQTKNLQPGIFDFIYYNKAYEPKNIDLPLETSFKGVEIGSMRSSWKDFAATFLAYSGGDNRAEHGHADKGGFVFDSQGVRWALDLGGDNYNLPGYGIKESPIYRLRTEGHNTYVIHPDKSTGQETDAVVPIIKLDSKPRGSIAVLDLESAYKKYADSAIRGYKLDEDRKTVTIRDEITKTTEDELYWFMHTKADVKINGNKAILTQDGKQMNFEFISNDPSAELSVMDALPLPQSPQSQGQNKNVGVKRLVIKCKKKGELTITVKMSQKFEGVEFEKVSDIPIKDWKLPDGQINPLPAISGITFNGVKYEDFIPEKTSYLVMTDNTTSLPKVDIVSDFPYEITQNNEGIKSMKVLVSDPTSPTNKNIYTFVFKKAPQLRVPDGLTEYKPVAIKASDVPQKENPETSANDKDFGTRWSAQGNPWLDYDLGEVKNVDAIGLAIYQGTEREQLFNILVSQDGKEYTDVGAYTSGGTTYEFEYYSFHTQKARFVRIVGHGTVAAPGSWTSITEFEVLGK